MTTSPRSRQNTQFRRGGGPGGRRRRDSLVGEDGTIDYKDAQLMRRLVNERGKLTPGRRLRMSSKMQRRASIAVKRARHLALIPMAPNHNYVTGAVQAKSRESQPEKPAEGDRTESSQNARADAAAAGSRSAESSNSSSSANGGGPNRR